MRPLTTACAIVPHATSPTRAAQFVGARCPCASAIGTAQVLEELMRALIHAVVEPVVEQVSGLGEQRRSCQPCLCERNLVGVHDVEFLDAEHHTERTERQATSRLIRV
tara:strand:+ start:82 stop:405 length:324 start_codon:yes stop_codon:yes gene_type:complete